MNTTIIVVSVCLAIYGVFSYLGLRISTDFEKRTEYNIAKELVRHYGTELLPDIIDGVTNMVSERMVRYLTLLIATGVMDKDECEEAITKTGAAYHEELKRD